MSFLHLEWFFLLFLLLPFGYFVLKLQSTDIESIFSKEVLEKILIKKQRGFSKKTRYIFLLLTLLMMIIALARPVLDEGKKQDATIEGFNLIVALDISRSMMAKDIFPNRLEYAKKLLNQIFDALPEANVAVIAFSKDAFLVSPFSSDKQSIKYLIKHLEPKYLSSSGSSLVSALQASQRVVDLLKEQKSALLIVSDGADGEEVQKASEFLEKLQVFVLNLGTQKGSVIELENKELLKDTQGNIVVSKRDDSLVVLSQESGGSFLTIPDNSVDIKPLIEDLKQKIKKQTIQKEQSKEYKELFYYPLIVALISLFFALNQPRFLAFVLVLFLQQNAEAGLLDFLNIKKANESYQNKEYEDAAKEFGELKSSEAKYNEANALYRLKKFEEAKKAYESIEGLEGEKEFQRLHNLGNSYANLGENEKAIESYEKALKIEEDEDTKFNLELLKRKQEQQQQQNKDQNNQDKNKEEKEKNQQNSSDKDEQKKEDEKSKEGKNSQSKKQEESKKENQEKSKKDKMTQETKDSIEQKPMSEGEAKKWEQLLKDQEIKTQPLLLQKNKEDGSEKNW